MNINVRNYCDYKIVNLKVDNTNIDLGFHTKSEALDLARSLLQTVNELVYDSASSEQEYLFFITSNC